MTHDRNSSHPATYLHACDQMPGTSTALQWPAAVRRHFTITEPLLQTCQFDVIIPFFEASTSTVRLFSPRRTSVWMCNNVTILLEARPSSKCACFTMTRYSKLGT